METAHDRTDAGRPARQKICIVGRATERPKNMVLRTCERKAVPT
jgi:hypothetical protein